jgi:N-acetylneuraminic acid mutarotase
MLAVVSGEALVMGGRTGAATTIDTNTAIELTGDIPASSSAPFTIAPSWAAKSALPLDRRDARAVVYGGQVYVSGGLSGSDIFLSSLDRYDPGTDTWTALAPMSTARCGHGACIAGDLMLVFGGQTTGFNADATVEGYDLTAGSWAGSYTSMSAARSHFGFATIEGRVHAFGGAGSGGSPIQTAERYDPKSNSWTALSNLPEALSGVLCLKEGGRWKLFGGENSGGAVSDRIYVYDRSEDSWTLAGKALPYPARDLCGFTAVHSWTHRGNAQKAEFCLIGGGHDGSGFRPDVFRFSTR